jgi:hypothetical protein
MYCAKLSEVYRMIRIRILNVYMKPDSITRIIGEARLGLSILPLERRSTQNIRPAIRPYNGMVNCASKRTMKALLVQMKLVTRVKTKNARIQRPMRGVKMAKFPVTDGAVARVYRMPIATPTQRCHSYKLLNTRKSTLPVVARTAINSGPVTRRLLSQTR